MVIVTDDERCENEGDLVMGASKAATEALGVTIRGGTPHCEPITRGAEFADAAASMAALRRRLSR
jgi:3,4-dihydroxy-2-butanone 4-phosphate synthase